MRVSRSHTPACHRLIPVDVSCTCRLLFACREVKQDSLGYSHFGLLYGSTVTGPMSISRELMTNEKVEPEVKTAYDYVLCARFEG